MAEHTLSSELDQLLAMARELEAHMGGVQPDAAPPPPARELCRALASSIHKAIRVARACCPDSPPPPAAGSPNAGGGDGDGAARSKKRKGMANVRRQVRVRSVQDVEPLDDGLSWRKYGQKDILGAKYPRAYLRCKHRHTQGCQATKQVQRADGDPLLFDVVYHGAHTCAQAAAQHAGGGAPPTTVAGAEQQQVQQFGGDVSSMLLVATEGFQGVVEPAMPLSFPSTPAGVDGGAVGGCFPFASPESYGCTAGDLGLGMDLELQFDEFFSDHSELFHSEIQNL